MDRRQVEAERSVEPSRTNEPGRVIDSGLRVNRAEEIHQLLPQGISLYRAKDNTILWRSLPARCIDWYAGWDCIIEEINQVGAGKAGVHLFHFEQSR